MLIKESGEGSRGFQISPKKRSGTGVRASALPFVVVLEEIGTPGTRNVLCISAFAFNCLCVCVWG